MSRVWPHSLPQWPLYEGAGRTLGDNLARFKPDVGREIRRRRTTAREDTYSLKFLMTLEQLAVFEAFYSETIADGAFSFQMMTPIPNRPSLVRIDGRVTIEPVTPELLHVSFELLRLN